VIFFAYLLAAKKEEYDKTQVPSVKEGYRRVVVRSGTKEKEKEE
jgi:hypothetical protein